MSKLKELEKRLRDEPENLGLRVMVAGAMHEAGRKGDAVELYRSVAIAYREQGRAQQALMVCRSILELAPDDAPCRALQATLIASQPAPPQVPSPSPSGRDDGHGDGPARRWTGDATPLPRPLPYHVADPTTTQHQRLRLALPQSLREELESYPDIAGIANAARQISDSLIAASRPDELDDAGPGDLDTGQLPRPSASPFHGAGDDGDDDPTLLAARGQRGAAIADDDKTALRELPAATTERLARAFLAPVPPHRRAAVLQRFRSRSVAAGTIVIRRGEIGPGLILVLRGRLDLQVDRADGARIWLGAIAPGEYVGEINLLARAPGMAHVVAAVDAEIMVLAVSDFYEITGAFPALRAELKVVAALRRREHEHRLRSSG